MGILGTGLDLRLAHIGGYAPPVIGEALVTFGGVVFVVLTIRWLSRIRSNPLEVEGESSRALTANNYGTIVISLALAAAAIAPYTQLGARALWFISSIAGAALIVYLCGKWIQTGVDQSDLTPAIFLPIVGNAVPVIVAMDIGVLQYAWFSFSLAFVGWIAFLPLSLYRLILAEPRLPRKLAPQLGILVASPAVLASAWYVLNGSRVDGLMSVLSYAALFFALLTIRLWRLAWGEPFNVAMWGWTFPAAALAGAFERKAFAIPSFPSTTLALALLWLAIGITSACIAGALRGWLREAPERLPQASISPAAR
jgi:tellurite resistance protein